MAVTLLTRVNKPFKLALIARPPRVFPWLGRSGLASATTALAGAVEPEWLARRAGHPRVLPLASFAQSAFWCRKIGLCRRIRTASLAVAVPLIEVEVDGAGLPNHRIVASAGVLTSDHTGCQQHRKAACDSSSHFCALETAVADVVLDRRTQALFQHKQQRAGPGSDGAWVQ